MSSSASKHNSFSRCLKLRSVGQCLLAQIKNIFKITLQLEIEATKSKIKTNLSSILQLEEKEFYQPKGKIMLNILLQIVLKRAKIIKIQFYRQLIQTKRDQEEEAMSMLQISLLRLLIRKVAEIAVLNRDQDQNKDYKKQASKP